MKKKISKKGDKTRDMPVFTVTVQLGQDVYSSSAESMDAAVRGLKLPPKVLTKSVVRVSNESRMQALPMSPALLRKTFSPLTLPYTIKRFGFLARV